MFQLIKAQGFEPPAYVKKLWLYTRKDKVQIGSTLTLPGLFQTYNYNVDWYLFWLVAILEFLGFMWMRIYTEIQLIFILALIGADFIFVIFKHFISQAKICEYENKWHLALYKHDNDVTENYQKIKMWKAYKYFCTLLIFLLACLKVVLFFAGYGQFEAMFVFIALIYLVIAVLHINVTGYVLGQWCFSWFFNRAKRKQQKILTKPDLQATDSSLLFSQRHELHFKSKYELSSAIDPTKPGNNLPGDRDDHVFNVKNENGLFNYILSSYGAMTDADRDFMLRAEGNNQHKEFLASVILEFQLKTLRDNGVPYNQFIKEINNTLFK